MFNKNKIKINNSMLIFSIIAMWYAITNLLWWHIHTPIIPFYDPSAAHFLDIFTEGLLFYNAPLLTWIFKILFMIFDKKYADIIIINLNYVFFLITVYFIYKIGKEIDSKETGNLAMILFALVPAVYWLSRHYGRQDYHVMSLITLNIYCLMKTDNFRDSKWSLIYGLSIGIGLLIKDSFLIYFFAPFCYCVFSGLKKKDKSILINILLSVFVAVIVAGWHYFRHDIIKKIYLEPKMDPVSLFAFDTIRNVTIGLYDSVLSLPVFFAFFAGLCYVIKKYKNKNEIMTLLWVIIPWGIITFMPQKKDPEYFAGIIPGMVLIAALFLSHIKPNILKKIILFFFITIGIVQYINFSFYPQAGLSHINIEIFGQKIRYYNTNFRKMDFDVKTQLYKITKTIDYINEQCPDSNICLYVNENSVLKAKVLRAGMLLRNMKVSPMNIERFILKYNDDAIVIVGELQKTINRNMDIIDEKFQLISTTFYLKSKQDIDNRIRIFKKKII